MSESSLQQLRRFQSLNTEKLAMRVTFWDNCNWCGVGWGDILRAIKIDRKVVFLTGPGRKKERFHPTMFGLGFGSKGSTNCLTYRIIWHGFSKDVAISS